MQQILLINDHTEAAAQAARIALTLAKTTNANLVLATVTAAPQIKKANRELVTNLQGNGWPAEREDDVWQNLNTQNSAGTGFKPVISHLDFSRYKEKELAAYINNEAVSLVIRGTSVKPKDRQLIPRFNVQSVLNKIRCPLLLAPESVRIDSFKQLCYLTDLRYCRLGVLKFVAEMATRLKAGMLVNHLSFPGTVDLVEPYAERLFEQNVSSRVNFPDLNFNNIREKDVARAVDVIINGMSADLIAVVHRQYHFRELVGRYITAALPESITVPLLVFPY